MKAKHLVYAIALILAVIMAATSFLVPSHVLAGATGSPVNTAEANEAASDNDTSLNMLSGRTFLDMPQDRFGGTIVSSTLALTSFSVENGILDLSGTVSYGLSHYPVHVTGELYASRQSSGIWTASKTTETTGNFIVLHVGLTQERTHLLSGIIDKAGTDPVLVIYLERQGTREISFFETNANILSQSVASDTAAEWTDDAWQMQVFQPVAGTEYCGSVSMIMGPGTDSSSVTFHEQYPYDDYSTITYYMLLTASANCPANIAQGSADFNHLLAIRRKWTVLSYAPGVEEPGSPFEVGSFADPVTFDAWAPGNDDLANPVGDYFLHSIFTGSYSRRVTPASVTVGVGLAVGKWVSGSASLTLSSWRSPYESDLTIYLPPFVPEGQFAKRINYRFFDRCLVNELHQFQVVPQVAWGVGSSYNKVLSAVWTIPVYAGGTYHNTVYLGTYLTYYSG